MKFIRLNGKKALRRLLINLSMDSIVALTCYAILKKHNNPPEDTPIMLLFIYSTGLTFFFLLFFAKLHAFCVSRRLFSFFSTLSIFDNNDSSFGYLNKDSRIFYTSECICGKIDGYPVVVSFELATGKGQKSKLNLYFVTTKYNHTDTESFKVELDWLNGYRPIVDIKEEVDSFVAKLKSKATAIGSFEALIAEKRLSLQYENK